MRILIITDAWYPQVNGVVRALETTRRYAEAAGHTVEVVGPDRFREMNFALNHGAAGVDQVRPVVGVARPPARLAGDGRVAQAHDPRRPGADERWAPQLIGCVQELPHGPVVDGADHAEGGESPAAVVAYQLAQVGRGLGGGVLVVAVVVEYLDPGVPAVQDHVAARAILAQGLVPVALYDRDTATPIVEDDPYGMLRFDGDPLPSLRSMDPENVIRNPIKWMQSLAMDSKGNIYVGWIMGGAMSKWERATNKVTVFPIPMHNAIPYGVVADRNDNIWMAQWSGGKITKFDTTNNQWTEYTPPTYPGHIRRLNVDSKNNIWAGIWAAGKRPGKLAKLDQTTGRFTEYTIPWHDAQPYDVAADADDNIWFADSPAPDRTAAIGKFNPRDGTFTFYPKPQFDADTPKIQITRDGAVWYSPRGSVKAPAISVMYPDMDRITTLGADYQNDPPGYPFRVTRTGTQ